MVPRPWPSGFLTEACASGRFRYDRRGRRRARTSLIPGTAPARLGSPMSAHRLRFVTLGLVAFGLIWTPAALGQGGQDGSIIGYVFDQNGSPLKGVKVT